MIILIKSAKMYPWAHHCWKCDISKIFCDGPETFLEFEVRKEGFADWSTGSYRERNKKHRKHGTLPVIPHTRSFPSANLHLLLRLLMIWAECWNILLLEPYTMLSIWMSTHFQHRRFSVTFLRQPTIIGLIHIWILNNFLRHTVSIPTDTWRMIISLGDRTIA